MKKTSVFKKVYNSRVFWGIISLLVSISLWVYVTGTEMEEYKRTFHGVRVELVGEASLRDNRNLVITDLDTSTVTIEVIGPRRIVGSLDEDELVARVDVSQLSRSAYTSHRYTIIYPDGTDTGKLTESRKSPEVVNFMVSEMTKKTVEVMGSFDGSIAAGFIAEPVVFEPANITISGPEVYLRNINRAWVSFAREEVDSSLEVETGFVLQDKNGEECSTTGLSFSAETVLARLPINQTKEVPLNVELIEGAGALKANTKITIEPKSVTLAGDSDIIAGINQITLATIDLTDFKNSFTDSYKIIVNDQLKNLSGVSEATVSIEVVGLDTKDFKIAASNLALTNITEGYTANIVSQEIVVTLRGTAEQLEKIKSENIRLVADLKDLNETTGSITVAAKVYVDGYTDVGAIGEYSLTIEIGKA